IGTGSVGWAMIGGRQYRVGGWGLLFSDEGSAAWLGREALRQALRAHDGRIAPTALLRRLLDEFAGDPYTIVRWADSARPADTGAPGSSADAATFETHQIELHIGIPVAAMAPNIATVYRRSLRLDGQLFLAISQSGRSDDLVETAAMARDAGAVTAAFVNTS